MSIQLDHFIVPSHDKVASAKKLGELLGVRWEAAAALGPFSPVYINEGLTMDFVETPDEFPVHHFCFRVGEPEFDAILGRLEAAGVSWRADVDGPDDRSINTTYGGRMVYWNVPDGHQWEMLTVSYAR
jgi:catechol 2,3-dioxygenase-like lactoylglutathione lyase family enzyme